jgi:pyridoxal phosphate enzyme (YggS family)
MTGLAIQIVEQRIHAVQRRIDDACARAGREPSSVTLIAVSKTVGRAEIDLAWRAGVRDFGENRVQSAVEKLADPLPSDARLHMIGHLQSNKAAIAVEVFDVIHSVDRESLVLALQKQADARGQVVDVLLQVNVAGESQKSGCTVENAAGLALQIAETAELNLLGLMTMAPLVDKPELVRPVFRKLAQTREELIARTSIGPLPVLSMGMTNDFEIAIEEGATHVRIGRAIFDPAG